MHNLEGEKGKGPHPHSFSLTKKTASFTTGRFCPYQGPRALYYKTHPCRFYHKMALCKAIFGSLVRTKLVLCKTGNFLCKAEGLGVGAFFAGTEKVPQRTCATKIFPNFRLNFLVQFASKPLFYWAVPRTVCPRIVQKILWAVLWLQGSFFGPLICPSSKPWVRLCRFLFLIPFCFLLFFVSRITCFKGEVLGKNVCENSANLGPAPEPLQKMCRGSL